MCMYEAQAIQSQELQGPPLPTGYGEPFKVRSFKAILCQQGLASHLVLGPFGLQVLQARSSSSMGKRGLFSMREAQAPIQNQEFQGPFLVAKPLTWHALARHPGHGLVASLYDVVGHTNLSSLIIYYSRFHWFPPMRARARALRCPQVPRPPSSAQAQAALR